MFTKLLSNPAFLALIAMLCLMCAAVDIQFVDAGPDNWFHVLHLHGKIAVIVMLAVLAWMVLRWQVWPVLWWAFRPGRPVSFEAGKKIPSNSTAVWILTPSVIFSYDYDPNGFIAPYRFMITITFLCFYVGLKFYRQL